MEIKELEEEVNELKTKIILLEEQLKILDEIPTYEKTKNMILHSLSSVPKEDKIIVIVQDTVKKEKLVNEEVMEKKIAKLKVWLFATVISIGGVALKVFL